MYVPYVFFDNVRLESKTCTTQTKKEITVPVEVVWLVPKMLRYLQSGTGRGVRSITRATSTSDSQTQLTTHQSRRQLLILSSKPTRWCSMFKLKSSWNKTPTNTQLPYREDRRHMSRDTCPECEPQHCTQSLHPFAHR